MTHYQAIPDGFDYELEPNLNAKKRATLSSPFRQTLFSKPNQSEPTSLISIAAIRLPSSAPS